jgi:hypothetical protein
MTLTPIERDLMQNAKDRLYTWAQDTMMRCDVVELSERTQVGIIMNCIFIMAARMAIEVEMPYNVFQDILRSAYAHEFEKNQREVKDKA